MRTVLIDYDSGNLHSAAKAFERMAGEEDLGEVIVSDKAEVLATADRIVLPGDGAFPACRHALLDKEGLAECMIEMVEKKGRPFLGICIGMQLMARVGWEYEETPGLNWISGEVRAIPVAPGLKVPHMGWNDLVVTRPHPVLAGIETGDHAYFVHSFQVEVDNPVDCYATADYGGPVTAVIGGGTVLGTQFHPEKSQQTGLRLISNFLKWAP